MSIITAYRHVKFIDCYIQNKVQITPVPLPRKTKY